LIQLQIESPPRFGSAILLQAGGDSDGRKAYVANAASNTISAIDTINRVVGDHRDRLPWCQELTVTPDGNYVFVVHQHSGYVAVIDTATDTLVTNVPVDGSISDILATRITDSSTWRIITRTN
jgi:YVTN family beta-propeller protein